MLPLHLWEQTRPIAIFPIKYSMLADWLGWASPSRPFTEKHRPKQRVGNYSRPAIVTSTTRILFSSLRVTTHGKHVGVLVEAIEDIEYYQKKSQYGGTDRYQQQNEKQENLSKQKPDNTQQPQ